MSTPPSDSNTPPGTTLSDSSPAESDPLVLGYCDPSVQNDAALALEAARSHGFDYVTTNLPTLPSSGENVTIRRDLTALEARWWRTSVVGVMQGPDLTDWKQQLPWAWHMNLPAVILPSLPSSSNELTLYAASLREMAQQAIREGGHSFQFWVPVPLEAEALNNWQYVSALAKSPILGVMLLLPAPAKTGKDPLAYVSEKAHLIHNAIGCGPVLAVSVATDAFLTNKKGFPTLSKTHQWLVEQVLQRIGRTVRWLLQGSVDSSSSNIATPLHFQQYLNHLRKRPAVTCVLDTDSAKEERDYLDGLQKPVQPLQDHLVYATYETFEKDPVKYAQYQAASRLALQQCATALNSPCHVLVVGAGRGPLVTGVLQAYCSLQPHERPPQLQITAVEKNPSAVLYLYSRLQKDHLWKAVSPVEIVQADLRDLDESYCTSADIVVSELLGSFGCNELSPECLDALLARCRATTISIPSRYTSYIAPISSAHIHHQIVQQQAFYPDTSSDQVTGRQRAVETPYVVRTHAASQTHAEQACWTFDHPAPLIKHDRVVHLTFGDTNANDDGLACGCGYNALDPKAATLVPPTSTASTVVTGLVGSFAADLFGDVQISTAPHSFSSGMYSWFPLYFPLSDPLNVPCGAQIQVSVWRRKEGDRVWYEWTAAVTKEGHVLSSSCVHNPGGRSYHVGLS